MDRQVGDQLASYALPAESLPVGVLSPGDASELADDADKGWVSRALLYAPLQAWLFVVAAVIAFAVGIMAWGSTRQST